MKIYLCSRYSRRDELRGVRDVLTAKGFVVTSRWLDTEWEENDGQGSSAAPPEYRREFAIKDMIDVQVCDAIIAFTEPPRSNGRGGRHVEFGMAAAWGKKLIVIGPEENIFHYLPGVFVYRNIEELLIFQEQWKR